MRRPVAQLSLAWLDEAVDPSAREAASAAAGRAHAPVPEADADQAMQPGSAAPGSRGQEFLEPRTPRERVTRNLLLTVPEAAAILSMSRASLYRLLGRGEIAVIKIGGMTRIPVAALEAFVTERLTADAAVSRLRGVPITPVLRREAHGKAPQRAGVGVPRERLGALVRQRRR